jgi:hypothetical protein
MAASETSVNLPFYGNITDTHPKHKFDITAANTATTGQGINTVPPYNSNSAYLIFARTGYLARGDRKNYVAPIQAFWRAYELKLYDDLENVIEPELLRLYKDVSPAASAKFITDYTIAVSDRAFRAAEKIHDALVAHMASAPNTLFKIPAELLEPTANETALRTPNADDKKAVDTATGSAHTLLTRDDGNVKVNTINASAAPDMDGYDFDLPGAYVEITLKPEQVAANQTAAKLLYEVKIDNSLLDAYGGNLEKIKKNLAFAMTVGGKNVLVVGPENALISFPDALAKGIATMTMTTDGIIVTLEYILVDGLGNSGVHNNRLVVCDGDPDGVLKGSIWFATHIPEKDPGKKGSGGGCDAGIAYAAMGIFAVLMFIKKRSK